MRKVAFAIAAAALMLFAGTLTTAEAIYGEDINENTRPDSFFDPNAEGDEEVESANDNA